MNHTPVSQEAVLEQIADHVRDSSIRFVSLSATNVFDELFLAKVLSRTCPDTRLVLQGADLLFFEEASSASLTGLLAISPFPLFPEGLTLANTLAQAPAVRDIKPFSTSNQVAEFNAMLALLRPFGNEDNSGYRQEYASALADEDIGSAWLLVLSSKGWMPLDLLRQKRRELEVDGQNVEWFDAGEGSHEALDSLTGMFTLTRGWMALCVLFAVPSLVFCGRLYFLVGRPFRPVWSSLCMEDLEVARKDEAIKPILQDRYFCMVACFACLAAANGFLLAPMAMTSLTHSALGFRDIAIISLVMAAFLLCAASCVWISIKAPAKVLESAREDGSGETSIGISLTITLRALVVLGAAAAIYLWWRCCSSGVAGTLLCFRTLELASPVSPIWPLLLSTIGIFALAFFHMRRFTWGDRRQPKLDTSLFDKSLCGEFKNIKCRFEKALISSVYVAGWPAFIVAASIVVVFGLGVLFLLPPGSLFSFEPGKFIYLLRIVLGLLTVYTVVTLYRFTWCWSLLRAFLVALNSVILGRYFMRVPEFGGGKGPVWIRGVKLMSLATAVNSCIALHNLELTEGTPGKYSREYMGQLQEFLSTTVPKRRSAFIRAYEGYREKADAISKELGEQILTKYWAANQLPFVGSIASGDDARETESGAEQRAISGVAVQSKALKAAVGQMRTFYRESHISVSEAPEPEPLKKYEGPSEEAYEQASRYVALHYSAYIGYALHQLQNLLICATVCFVLLVLALNSFDFQAPQAIFQLVSAGLVIGGAAVLVAFVQMERDPILSRLSGTEEGALGKDFYLRVLAYGAVPVLTVLTTEFPAIARYVGTFIQPMTAGLR